MKLAQRMLTATAVLLFGTVMYACGGGSSIASGTITQADFNKLLATATAFTDLQSAEKTDATDISRIKLAGHVPGSAASVSGAVQTLAVTQAVDNTDYGQCTTNGGMGQFAGHGPADTDGSVTDLMKNCTGNKALINSTTGEIGHLKEIWFTQANCQGTAFEIPEASSIDRPTLAAGLIFKSPADDSVVWSQPMAAGTSPPQMQALSNYSAGACNTGVIPETGEGFVVVANVTDGAFGSGVPDNGVPNTYVYN